MMSNVVLRNEIGSTYDLDRCLYIQGFRGFWELCSSWLFPRWPLEKLNNLTKPKTAIYKVEISSQKIYYDVARIVYGMF